MNVSHQKAWNSGFAKLSSLFFPIMPYGHVFAKFKQWPCVADLNAAKPSHVQSFLSHSICFVEQKGLRQEKCFSQLYEPRVFLCGEVNSRLHSWHDFFNAQIWYAFPKTKSVLNMRQFIAFDESASFPWKMPVRCRTREQDYLTMFDEGGCILVTFPENISIPFLFGHGFYEQIFYGNTDLSACTLKINLDFNLHKTDLVNFTGELARDVLFAIDSYVAGILSDRNYYKKEGAFCSVHMSSMKDMMNK